MSEDDDLTESDIISGRSRLRETRNKKISERSDAEAEESPGPPRTTRRSKNAKVDASNDGSTDREDGGGTTAAGVENKRLSRVKDTEKF